MSELTYKVPDQHAPAVSEAVLETLKQLGIEWDYDDTSPPNKHGDVTYTVRLKGKKP